MSFRRCRARWLFVLALRLAVSLPATTVGQSLADVEEGLRARSHALDHLKVDFHWGVCRAWLRDDPFEPKSWHMSHKSAHAFECHMWIVRPDFQWWRVGPPPFFDGGATTSWIDGKMVQVAFDPQKHWSVLIDRARWNIHGPVPVLTPFDMQVCDWQESLLEVIRRSEMRVVSHEEAHVVLVGQPTYEGRPSGWMIKATLDPSRGWLPVELRAEMPYGAGGSEKIDWTVRTIATTPIRGVHAVREAIFAMSNGREDRWQIYHFNASSIVRDNTLTKADLSVPIPEKNLRLVDRVTGLVRFTDEEGEVIQEYVKTPEEVIEDQEALSAAAVRADEAQRQLAQRRERFGLIVAAGGITVVAAAGVWGWRRYALRAA